MRRWRPGRRRWQEWQEIDVFFGMRDGAGAGALFAADGVNGVVNGGVRGGAGGGAFLGVIQKKKNLPGY